MSQTKVNLGRVPKERGEYSATAKYYKDNIVEYGGSAYIASPTSSVNDGNDGTTDNPEYYLKNRVPFVTDPNTANAGWRIFASGRHVFSTGEDISSIGIDDEPTAGSRNLVESGGVFKAVSNTEVVTPISNVGRTYIKDDGTVAEAPASAFRVYTYNIEEEKEYYASGYVHSGGDRCGIYYYDENDNPISGEQQNTSTKYGITFTQFKLTIPVGTKTVKISGKTDIQSAFLNSIESLLNLINQETQRALEVESNLKGENEDLSDNLMKLLGTPLMNIMNEVIWDKGYINIDGSIIAKDEYRYSTPFNINANDVVIIYSYSVTSKAVIPISEVSGEGTDESPYIYTPLVVKDSNYRYVIYRPKADKKISISVRKNFIAGCYDSCVLVYLTKVLDDIETLDDKIEDKDLTNTLSLTSGSYQIENNTIVLKSDSQYRHTTPFEVKKDDIINFEGSISMPTSRILIVGVTGEGTTESPFVYENLDNRTASVSAFKYIADTDRKISICFRPGTDGYKLSFIRKSSINNNIDNSSKRIYNTLEYISDGYYTTLDIIYSTGGIAGNNGENGYSPYRLRSDFIYIGNVEAIRFDCTSELGFVVYEYDKDKKYIRYTVNKPYIELSSLTDNTKYVRIVIIGNEENPAQSSSMKISVKPVTAMINNRRLMSNINIKCLAHQGIGLNGNTNSRSNLLSSFWGAYLYGFDSILVNVRFTSDDVAVCVHDASVSYNDVEYTIASTSYNDLVDAATTAGREHIATLDSVIKLAKMLGLGVFIVNTPTSTSKLNIVLGIVGKYKMNNNTIFLCDDSIISTVISKGNKNVALLQPTIASTDYSQIEDVVARAITVSTANPDATVYIWINNGHSVQNFENAAIALKDYSNIKIGMFNNDTSMTTDGFILRMPYISMYSSHFSSFGQNRRQVELALANEFPEILGCTYGNLI